MEHELQGKLVEILTSIQSGVGQAKDFALSQLPDIAQSYIAYGRAYTTALAVMGIASLLGTLWACHVVRRKVLVADAQFAKDYAEWKETKANYGEPVRGHYFEASDALPFQFIPAMFGVVLIAMDMQQLFLVWFAPKVWLLKELAHLVK